jgi:hypothetical protein
MPVPGRCLGFVLDDAIDLLRWDTEPPKRIRGVSYACIDTQNAFLCRQSVVPTGQGLADDRISGRAIQDPWVARRLTTPDRA